MRLWHYSVCLVAICFAMAFALMLNASEPQAESGLIRQEARGVYEKVAPTVVRIAYGDAGASSISGVIVSADGHVLTYGIVGGGKVVVFLPDGRSVNGNSLGWSEELGIGLVKLAGKAQWPHVKLDGSPFARTGDSCVALGYPRCGDGKFNRKPALRLGRITASAPQTWFSSSCALEFDDIGCGVFNLEGRLLGVTTRLIGGLDSVQTGIEMVRTNFDVLSAGKQLDGEMLGKFADTKRQLSVNVAPKSGDSIERAKAATVRIRAIRPKGTDESPSWSGVIVTPDGYVATCAHTGQLPEDKIRISLPDGRDVEGIVLGTNRVADVGLVVISGDGPWPFVSLGESIRMEHNDPTFIIGYPAYGPDQRLSHDRQPLVQNVPVRQRPNFLYPYLLITSRDYDLRGGMSGGGVFDREGRLVAVHCGSGNPRIEVLRRQWDSLSANRERGFKSEPPGMK